MRHDCGTALNESYHSHGIPSLINSAYLQASDRYKKSCNASCAWCIFAVGLSKYKGFRRRCCLAFFHIKPTTRKLEPVEDLPQHFTFFDASSESLTLIGVDITRESLHQGLPGVRVCVCVCVCVGGGAFMRSVFAAGARRGKQQKDSPAPAADVPQQKGAPHPQQRRKRGN